MLFNLFQLNELEVLDFCLDFGQSKNSEQMNVRGIPFQG